VRPWSQLRSDERTLLIDLPSVLAGADQLQAQPVAGTEAELAEHPVWSSRHDALVWVDITAGRVLQTTASGQTSELFTSAGPVGAALVSPTGRLVLVAAEGVLSLAADGSDVRVLADPPPAGLRFNDAGLDPRGRLWAGVLPLEDPAPGMPLAGELWRLDDDGHWESVFTEMGCPNGIVWSEDARTILCCESDTRRIAAADYDLETGLAANWRVAWEFAGAGDWVPDGLEWLADGRLWIGFWGVGTAARFTPSGKLDQSVGTADLRTTSVATDHDGVTWITAASGLFTVSGLS
jgi:sugar lactone lactonase YvrE